MRLTIIAPDNVFEHEVDPSMEVQDVQALIEAEVSCRTQDCFLVGSATGASADNRLDSHRGLSAFPMTLGSL